MRCVVDTNVAVSALVLPFSVPRRAIDWVLERGTLLISWPVLAEMSEVLGRPRFRRYVREEVARNFLYSMAREAEWVETPAEVIASRDPKDNKFLSLALSGRATHIITGDKDLLVLDPFREIRILNPADFLSSVASG